MNSITRRSLRAPPPPPPAWTWERLRGLVVDSVSSVHSRRMYGKALDGFQRWCKQADTGHDCTRSTVQRYRAHLEARGLGPSSINLHLTAIRRLAREAAANGLMAYETALSIAAVKGKRPNGRRPGTWLSVEQAQSLLQAPKGKGIRAKRDRALLAVLVGCGLRRGEIAALEIEGIQHRDGRWLLVNVQGKRNQARNVPMPTWAKAAIDHWTAAAALERARLFRPIAQNGAIGRELTPQAVYLIVKGHARQLGLNAAPHDLRRAFAKLAHLGRSDVEQIQLSLGHDSISTTELYLGIRQSLTDAPCDRLGIEIHDR